MFSKFRKKIDYNRVTSAKSEMRDHLIVDGKVNQNRLLEKQFAQSLKANGTAKELGELMLEFIEKGDHAALNFNIHAGHGMLALNPKLEVKEHIFRQLDRWLYIGTQNGLEDSDINYAINCTKLAGIISERNNWHFTREAVDLWQTSIEVCEKIKTDSSYDRSTRIQASEISASSMEVVGDLSEELIKSLT